MTTKSMALSKPYENNAGLKDEVDDILSAYIKKIRKIPKLNKKEELELAKKIYDGDENAKKELLSSNLYLSVNIAKKLLYTSNMPLIDLIQEGNLGLMVAVEKYNYKLGYRFSTYATWWVKQAIYKAISEQSRVFKIPVYIQETLAKFSKIKHKLEKEYNCQINNEVVAKEMNIDKSKIDLYLNAYVKTISIESDFELNFNGSNMTLNEILVDEKSSKNIDNDIEYLKSDIEFIVSKLKQKERNVLMFRYGLNNLAKKTLEEIGNIYGVTKECIRQTEKRALRKIREDKFNLSLLEAYRSI